MFLIGSILDYLRANWLLILVTAFMFVRQDFQISDVSRQLKACQDGQTERLLETIQNNTKALNSLSQR